MGDSLNGNSFPVVIVRQNHPRQAMFGAGTQWMALLLMTCLFMSACQKEAAPTATTGATNQPVDIQIDFNGRGQNKQFHMEWSPDLTAFNILERLQADGKLKVTSRGTEDQTLLTSIDGLENLWAAGDNWIYFVDDRLGDRSSAVYHLEAGNRVVWRFGKYAAK